MNEMERLQEVERQAIAEGCDIGSDQQAPVWLINQRAEIAELRLADSSAEIERLLGLLKGRDDFIVGKGLWSEFTGSLPRC